MITAPDADCIVLDPAFRIRVNLSDVFFIIHFDRELVFIVQHEDRRVDVLVPPLCNSSMEQEKH